MSTVSFTLRMNSEVKKQLEIEAKSHDRSSSYIVNQIINNHFKSLDAERLAIKKAITEANKGVFVSHESMREWFASLGTTDEFPFPGPDVLLTTKK